MSPKKSGKMTGGTVGKRTMIDPTASINSALSSFPSQGPSISSSQGPRLFNPAQAVNSALSSFPSQGPTPINKGGAMTPNAMTPGQSQGPRLFDPAQAVNSAMSSFPSQGPRLFNPNSTINSGGAMTPNAMSGIGYGSSQGPTTFDPTQEMNRTIGRGAGEFGIQGRSLVPSKDLKSRGRSL
tara:strand:+ start:76 stop:621 length:546 start_codon:yes stop_codon:yes gene_type:complete